MAKDSQTSLKNATKGVADFSEHQNAIGAAGHREDDDLEHNQDPLLVSTAGESVLVDMASHGNPDIKISLSWDNVLPEQIEKQSKGFFDKLFKSAKQTVTGAGVDIDLGCLYELKNGERGCLQPFGDMLGDYDQTPYIQLSGDERTGDTEGIDEEMVINGQKWSDIKRILLYIYIYQGAANWKAVKPEIFIDIPGDEDLKMVPHSTNSHMMLCAVGSLKNVDGGIELTNHSEYFPGHAEMDRAFGFGLEWEDGEKD